MQALEFLIGSGLYRLTRYSELSENSREFIKSIMSTHDRFTPTKNFRFQKFGLRCRPNGSTGRVRWQNFLLSRISFANKCMLYLAVFSGLQGNFLAQYQVGENTGLLHFNQLFWLGLGFIRNRRCQLKRKKCLESLNSGSRSNYAKQDQTWEPEQWFQW